MGILITVHNFDIEPNPGQQQVYDHKSGPLLIVAGAGTGKTSTITEKIRLLLDEGVEPASILAVTFTEKAAQEMQDRILSHHDGLLLDLPIMTYNGYGDSLLREFGIHIGLPRNFRLLTSQAAIVFVRERFDQFNFDYFYPATGSPDGTIEQILKYFSKLKQNLVTPDSYKKYVTHMPASDEAEKIEKRMHTELSQAFATYLTLCRNENVIDYDDQIYLTIQLLESRPNVCKTLKGRYHTVFVDEFQDTNPMQSKFIDLIVPESRNLIVVGDDDQAIYGFRGATISNILDFKDRYPDTAEAALTINYRSHQSILDAAYTLIQHNNPYRLEASLGLNKRLTSDRPGSEPELKHFEDPSQELSWLAQDIADRLDTIKPDEKVSIAVLTRSNNGAHAVHQMLATFNIPHTVVGLSSDLYEQPIIRTVREFLRTLVEPDSNISLHHTLIGEVFGIDSSTLEPHVRKANREHESLEDLLAEVEHTKSAIEMLRTLRKDVATDSVGRLLWRALSETGVIERLRSTAETDDAAGYALGHLSQFFDTLKEFESIATQPTTVQYLLALPALMAAGENTDGTTSLSENEIIVTTVHKAKGLEWNTVYLPQLNMQKFPMYKQSEGIVLPDALRIHSMSEAEEHYKEERRVMYVAITRARQNLIMSYSDGKRKPSMFLNEIYGDDVVASTPLTLNESKQAELQLAVDELPAKRIPTRFYDGKTVTLDVTHAQTLLNCPRNFYFKYVIETPQEPGPATEVGTQMHGFIEEINKARRDGLALHPLEELQAELVQGWSKVGYHSKAQQERRLETAKQALTNFYNHALESPAPSRVEEAFRVNLTHDIILKGRIDAVYEHDGVEIRDFKTGQAGKDQKTADKNANDSRQLELYALAWLLQHDEMPDKLSLHYVDTNIIGSSSRKKQKTIETRRETLINAVEELKKGIFPLGSSHYYCEHP